MYPNWSSMTDNAITQGGKRGLGPVFYVCGLNALTSKPSLGILAPKLEGMELNLSVLLSDWYCEEKQVNNVKINQKRLNVQHHSDLLPIIRSFSHMTIQPYQCLT